MGNHVSSKSTGHVVGHKYVLGNTIGKGHFSVVKHAVNRDTKEEVAIKVMAWQALAQEGMEPRVRREIAVLRKMNHPNIVKLLDVVQTRKHIYIVLELVTGGELFDKIVQSGKFEEPVARHYFEQLTIALFYCHKSGVAHRDLKPENLLLDSNGQLKISDFGLSNEQRISGDGSIDPEMHTECGTVEYVAPEVISCGSYNGFKADMWSCGVILFAMASGTLPFYDRGRNMTSVRRQVMQGKYVMKPFFSAPLQDLISHLLVVDPDRRYSLEEVFRHPWMQMQPTQLEGVVAVPPVNTTAVEVELAIRMAEDDLQTPRELVENPNFVSPSFTQKKANMRFGMAGTLSEVFQHLSSALADLNCHPQPKPDLNTIKGCLFVAGGDQVKLSVTVTPPGKEGLCIVEVRRTVGPTLEFHTFYRELLTCLSSQDSAGAKSVVSLS